MMDGDDGGRTKRITFYVDAEERETLRREADAADMSRAVTPSTWCVGHGFAFGMD